jgi:hypothetical protein
MKPERVLIVEKILGANDQLAVLKEVKIRLTGIDVGCQSTNWIKKFLVRDHQSGRNESSCLIHLY